jgi:hypothetical protein
MPLSLLATMPVTLGLEIVDERVEQRCANAPNYAAYTLGIVLTTAGTPAPQALYYQVMFRDSRGLAVARRWCPGYEFADTAVFCVDEGLAPIYGQPEPEVGGGRRAYSFDLLARLRAVILSSHRKQGAPRRGSRRRPEPLARDRPVLRPDRHGRRGADLALGRLQPEPGLVSRAGAAPPSYLPGPACARPLRSKPA